MTVKRRQPTPHKGNSPMSNDMHEFGGNMRVYCDCGWYGKADDVLPEGQCPRCRMLPVEEYERDSLGCLVKPAFGYKDHQAMTVKEEKTGKPSKKVTLRQFISEILNEPASRWYWWLLFFMLLIGILT